MLGRLKSPMINNELYLLARLFSELKKGSYDCTLEPGGIYARQIIIGWLIPIGTVRALMSGMEVDDSNWLGMLSLTVSITSPPCKWWSQW